MGGASNLDEVELFLKNMFSDKNILPIPFLFRKIVANIIIKSRLEDVKENFKLIGGASPLNPITQKLVKKLESKFDIPIVAVMRYVPPFASEFLKKFKNEGIEELILFPMYPQYSTTTTLSSVQDVQKQCQILEYYPQFRLVNAYYDDKRYIKILAQKIIESMKNKEYKEYDFIISAHGLPQSIVDKGDPYQKEVEQSVELLSQYLQKIRISFNSINLAYQSKVGKGKWLEPNLLDTLRNSRSKKVLILPLSFTIDNSETIFELDIEAREIAEKLKYDEFIVVQCPNDDDNFAEFIYEKISNL
jgi:ferrochelatase